MSGPAPTCRAPRRWVVVLILIGVFLSTRGYRSLEGDQAYRLPILLHKETPALYRDDPFVRSFDAFNPHRGALALIALASRPFGLSVGLAGLFSLTLVTACFGLDRLTRTVWPDAGPFVGLITVALAFSALAGNIGTNHLIEPILLDRQVAFALGWVGLASLVGNPKRGVWLATLALALATLIHPTLGLQMGGLLMSGWLVWQVWPREGPFRPLEFFGGLAALSLAVVPGLALNLAGSGQLSAGIDPATFRLLSVELQSPQHMLPHLWRWSQWLAWGCYPVLALMSFVASATDRNRKPLHVAQARLAVLLGLNLLALGLAWYGIERLGNLRLTLFQPFRLATLARGVSLVFLADHCLRLWRTGRALDRTRAVLLVVGLTGDWRMVIVTLVEVLMAAADVLDRLAEGRRRLAVIVRAFGGLVFLLGVVYLARHDTESGHVPLIATVGVSLLAFRFLGDHRVEWTAGRQARVAAVAWVVPIVAMVSAFVPEGRSSRAGAAWRDTIVRRCRFGEVPVDDVERLGLWCRQHTPTDAVFVGPPGPKAFRLWSHRSLTFNRAGSPYNARGLVDWAERFRDHVGFDGTLDEFVAVYLRDRHGLERGYEGMSARDLAALADRQGAGYVLAAAPPPAASGGEDTAGEGLKLLHVEGRMAVYRRTDRDTQIARAPMRDTR